MDLANERLASIYKGRAYASWIMCASVILLAAVSAPHVLIWLALLALAESTLNQPYLYPRQAAKLNPVTLARINLTADIIVYTIGLHFFGGFRGGILVSGYMLIMLYAFLAVRPKEGIIATVLSIGAFAIMYLLESRHIISEYPPLIVGENTGTAALIIIALVLLILPAYVGRNIYKTILGQEKKLQRALDRNVRLFLAARDAILLLSPEARVELANPRAAELFKLPITDMPGRLLTEVLAPESSDDFAVLIQNVSTGQPVSGSNLRLRLPDGAERVAEVTAMPYSRGSEPPGVFIVLRDVTERRNLEGELKKYSEELELRVERRTAELEESKERYQSTFEKAAVPLAWLDPDGTLQSANRFFYKLTGLDKSVEGSYRLVELLDRLEDRERVADYLILHRKGYDAPTRLELAIRTAAGKLLFTEWFVRFEPLTDQLLVSIIDETIQRLAEMALRESEEKYRALVETSPDSIVVSDLEGKVIMANRQAVSLRGCETEEELIGRDVFEFIAPQDRARARENARKVVETGGIQGVEYTILKEGGATYIGELNASVIRDAEGRPKYFLGVTRDVTGRKKIQDALKESELRYRSLFEQSRDVIYITTREGKFLDINPAATGLFGYSRQEMIGMDVRRIYADPAARDRFKNEVEKTGALIDYEIRFLKKDGTVMDCLLTSTVRCDAAGAVVGYQGIIRDITEKKRAEQALKESEARYRLLVETSPDAIIATGRDALITTINQKALKIFGADKEEEVLGRSAWDFAPMKDNSRVEELAARIREVGSVGSVEFDLLRRDGSSVPVEISASAIRDREGNPAGFVGVIRDITDRRRVEQELNRYRERLEELVERRTAELTAANEQLKNEITERERVQESLRESEAKYRALFESAPEIVAVIALDGTILDFNAAQGMLSGLSREEMIGKPFHQAGMIGPKDVPGYADLMTALLRGEKVPPLEIQVSPPGAEPVWLDIHPSALQKEGKVYAIQVISRDISARKRAEAELNAYRERLEDLVEKRTAALIAANDNLRSEIAQKEEAQLALQESERRYRTLFQDSRDAVYLVSTEGKLLDVNDATVEMSGYTRDELLGIDVRSLYVDPGQRKVYRGQIEKNGSVRDFEVKLRNKSGSVRDVIVTSTLWRGSDGKVLGYHGILRDVTDMKASERALKESEHRYRTLVETSPDAIIMLDMAGNIITANRRAIELWGGPSLEDLVGKNSFPLVAPRDRDRSIKRLASVVHEGQVRDYELSLLRHDGSEYPAEASGTLLRDTNNQPVAVIVAFRDVTERRRAELALRQSEARLRSILENSPDIIVILDHEHKVRFANRALTPRPVSEAIGKSMIELAPEQFRESTRQFMQRVAESPDQMLRETVQFLDRWFVVRAVALKEEGVLEGIMIIMSDITERQEVEEARQRLQDQLLQAEHMAGVGQVAAGVAHDMNSPLTAISYYAQALQKLNYIKKADRDKVAHIAESADRIQRLIARIINYASTQSAELLPMDLNTLVRQVLDALSHELEARPKAVLKTRLDSKIPPVNGSTEHLFDLLSNLVINALQALGKKKGQVTVTTRFKRPMVELVVADTGVGIPPKDLPDIFTPFVSRRKDGQGTGLGLAIVQRVAKLHGGEVKVESKPGKGTTVTVRLPTADKS